MLWKKLIEPRKYHDRDDAVLIEQAYKFGWSCIDVPNSLESWVGCTELTTQTGDEFELVIELLEVELLRLGRWNFAREYCHPAEVERALLEVDQGR